VKQLRRALELAPNLKDAQDSLAVALGEKPDPSAGQKPRSPPGPEQKLTLPTSPTLGPSPDALRPKPLFP
jgi:hypothetical protein